MQGSSSSSIIRRLVSLESLENRPQVIPLPIFYLILRSYELALTQLNLNFSSQMVKSWILWHEANLEDIPFSIYFPKASGEGEKMREQYYFTSWEAHFPFVLALHTSIKEWKSSLFWAFGRQDTIQDDPTVPLTIPTTFSTVSKFYCQTSIASFMLVDT